MVAVVMDAKQEIVVVVAARMDVVAIQQTAVHRNILILTFFDVKKFYYNHFNKFPQILDFALLIKLLKIYFYYPLENMKKYYGRQLLYKEA